MITIFNLLADFCFNRAGYTWITNAKKTAGRCSRGEPIPAGQALHQRHEVHLQVYRGMFLRDLPQGLHSLVSHNRFLHSRQTLQGRLTENYQNKHF